MGKKIGTYLAIYGAWLASSALALLAFLASRQAIINLAVRFVNKWARSALVNWSMLLFGLIWLVVVIFVENYYREGSDAGLLSKRFGKVTLYEVAVTAAAGILILLAG